VTSRAPYNVLIIARCMQMMIACNTAAVNLRKNRLSYDAS